MCIHTLEYIFRKHGEQLKIKTQIEQSRKMPFLNCPVPETRLKKESNGGTLSFVPFVDEFIIFWVSIVPLFEAEG